MDGRLPGRRRPKPANLSNTKSRDITVTCVNDAPVADDETFNGGNGAIGNTTFVVNDPSDGAPTATHPKKTITGDVLDGDADVDGPGPLTVTAGTYTAHRRREGHDREDGDFVYEPPADELHGRTDTFDYTVEDRVARADRQRHRDDRDRRLRLVRQQRRAAATTERRRSRSTRSRRPRPRPGPTTPSSSSTATTRRPATRPATRSTPARG